MSFITIRKAFPPCVAIFIVSVLPLPQTAFAQAPMRISNSVAEDLRGQIDELQVEVNHLRGRDAERQTWEASVIKRLPPANVNHLITERRGLTLDGDGGAAECDCSCGCYPCLCPLPKAPCIPCPRVSTAHPYFNIHIFGHLKTDILFNQARPISPGTPFFLAPGPLPGFDEQTFDIHARQTTLGAAFTGPQFHGFQSGGLALVMFFNDSIVADQYGLLPLQLYGDLKNENWRFAAGLQFDVFNPRIPTMLPFSALTGSGNAGNAMRGQLRLERFLHPSNDVQWTLQLALGEPIASNINPDFRLSEDNGWPNVEGRIALAMGTLEGADHGAQRPFELGVSGVGGQIRTTEPAVRQVVADVWGVGADVRWKINDCFGVQGEVYTGQTLGTYNGAILQTINTVTLQGIRSTGGWGEVYYYWTPCLHSHVGYGIDVPIDRDVAIGGATRNSTLFANVLWDLNETFRIGFEFTWRETDYRGLLNNEGAGFHTQFQWAF